MVRLYIINISNTNYYNFAESVNISLYLKSLDKYCPLPINKEYLNYNINPAYEALQTIIATDEPFYFVRLLQLQFKQCHSHEGWFQFTPQVLSEVKKFISPFIQTNASSVITDEALYKCTICNQKTFNNTKSLHKHISECSKNFNCSSCGKEFVSQTCYINHIKSCSVLECDICNKQFSSKQSLDIHILNCGNFSCEKCNLTFTTKHKFITHCQNIHNYTPIV